MKVGIIGAGPAGLSCALALVKKGIEVEIFEASPYVGGMARSFALWGQIVDLGPHRFFSMDKRVNTFWGEQLGDEYIVINRLTRIFYNKKFYHYPIKAVDALLKLGLWEAFLCMASYTAAQFKKRGNEISFEEWVSNRFGHRLYSIFFKAYSERLWGIPCTELDADFAAQRIKGLNLLEVVKSTFNSKGGKKHKTLVDQFTYPKFGSGQAYDMMARKIGSDHIHLKTPAIRILTESGIAKGIEFADGTSQAFDHVVSTAPLTHMVCSIPEVDPIARQLADELTYRNTTLVYLQVKKQNIFKDNWIYVHEKALQVGRISNFRNWSKAMWQGHEEAILALEYWSYDTDELWNLPDDKLVDQAKRDIVATGLVESSDILQGHVVKLHRSYPVYTCGYRSKMTIIQNALNKIDNLSLIGRNGSFKYNNQDHSILMGLLAAENIVDGSQHDLWQINTDYDYQERGSNDFLDTTTSPKQD